MNALQCRFETITSSGRSVCKNNNTNKKKNQNELCKNNFRRIPPPNGRNERNAAVLTIAHRNI